MTLLDAVRIARRFWMTIAACILLAVGLAAAYAASQPRLYTATSSAFVSVPSNPGSDVSELSVGTNVAAVKASAYAPLTQSGDVAQRVIDTLGLTESSGEVSGSIGYQVEPSSPRIQVTATSTSPQKAKDIANAVVDATAKAASSIESGGDAESGAVRLIPVTDAVLPSKPSTPNVLRILLIGLAGGLVLAYGVVMLRLRLDTKIRRPEDITSTTDIGLIGTIPKSRDLRSRLHSEDLLRGAVGESLRHLRTNLMFADPDTSPRSVVVTSPQPGEGKSTVSALLARALALRGGKVVLVDGDLRRPMVASLFDIDTGIGLTQVLSGAVPLDEALVETDTVGLLVLPAGRIPHNPSEVVGSERMRDLIAELSSDHLVVIDAPPALPVTDAMIMAQRVDGIIVVTFMAKSRKEHLRKVLQLAHGVNVRVFGIVLNGIPQGRAAGVYGYETYGYASDDRRFRQQKKKRRGGTAGRPAPKPAADPEEPDRALDLALDLPSDEVDQPPEPVADAAPLDGAGSDDLNVPDDIETSPARPAPAPSKR
jgi:capsular exopolysaccharide synthesis family protein